MKVWYKLILEEELRVGFLNKDSTFKGGWKIESEDKMSVYAITLIKDFKMYK